jgi:hypothetical protein
VKRIEGRTFDEERAFYGVRDTILADCRFDGPADGESAFKECRRVTVEDSYFNLRYPFWHDKGAVIARCVMTENCRAALWYSEDITVRDTKMHGIKALRECRRVQIAGCDIRSPEFGWSVRDLSVEDSRAEGEYFLLRAERVRLTDVVFSGKYSFQYVKGATLDGCTLHTKDAFWHAKNVTVTDSVLEGEYLGWYSEGLTLVRCKICGTQPLCYCKDLRLIDCEMEKTDLSFEYSDVEATVRGHIMSVKNPKSGKIEAESVGEVIYGDAVTECSGKVIIK